MTTQPPDLKKLREDMRDLAATLRGRALFLEDRKEVKSPQIMREAATAILALLDAYEASARDAERLRAALVQIEQWAIKGRHEEDFEAIEKAARHATQGD